MRRAVLLLTLLPSVALATALPITLDGLMGDWPAGASHTDPAGDGGASGIDFGELDLANDGAYLFVRLQVGAEVTLQETPGHVLYLDTDDDPATGIAIAGMGADLIWDFGDRRGTFRGATIWWDDLGLLAMPSHAAPEFELALRRDATPAGQPLFDGGTVRVLLRDTGTGGDTIPDAGSIAYTFDDSDPQTPEPIALAKHPDHVRVATFNTLFDGLWDRPAESARLLTALDADILAFQEIYDHSMAQTRSWVQANLGGFWHISGNGYELQVVSRHPILGWWQAGPRGWAVLIDLPSSFAHDLFLVNVHLSCCSNDAARQEQIDQVMALVRDAMEPGGLLELPQGTPMMITGDTNMYGDAQQVRTLLTGDIADNASFGPDFAPDWDGSGLDPLYSTQLEARLCYTWYNEGSSYSPSHIDRIALSGSAFSVAKSFVLHTPDLAPATLAAAGLQADDSLVASDHVPHAMDIMPMATAVGHAPAARLRAWAAPNPFNPATRIGFEIAEASDVSLTVHDVAGRVVSRMHLGPRAAGRHQVDWVAPTSLASGVYVARVEAGGGGGVVELSLVK